MCLNLVVLNWVRGNTVTEGLALTDANYFHETG